MRHLWGAVNFTGSTLEVEIPSYGGIGPSGDAEKGMNSYAAAGRHGHN